ncbi:MAG: PadR family transcriptional regulator [Candidatus Nanopelagicales bacterium]
MAVAKRSILQFAVLGLLHEGPLHGYELRKRLNGVLGTFRAISYGSLYPCLKEMLAAGLITEDGPADAGAPALSGRRARIVYKLTPEGKDRFQAWLADAGPEAYEDELFGVHLAFFSRTDRDIRLRILLGRRNRLEERLATLRSNLMRRRERLDEWTLTLQQHGLDSVEREVDWLSQLIDHEIDGKTPSSQRSTGSTPASK